MVYVHKVGPTETYYRYDGLSNHVLFEENESGAITKSYTYDTNGNPLTMTYNNQTYNYLANYRGDVIALTDASGNVVAEYTYDAWGNILTQTGKMATVNPYRYAGYRYDEEMKLYYLMARYYNPDTGVFLSLDPVRGDMVNPITMNGYNYANNNPVMNVDPDGLASMRVRDLILAINTVVAAIPQLRPVVKALTSKAFYKLKNLLKEKTVKDKIIEASYSGMRQVGMKKVTARQVSLNVINFILSVRKISIGDYVVALLKKKLKTYNKSGKQYYLFGKKKNYEYITFF